MTQATEPRCPGGGGTLAEAQDFIKALRKFPVCALPYRCGAPDCWHVGYIA